MIFRVVWTLAVASGLVLIPSVDAQDTADEEAEEEAEESGPAGPKWEGIWTLYGLSVARHSEGDANGYAIGIELSDVHLYRNQLWYGYYADLRYSSLGRGVDLSVGVEAGASVFGVDAGLYARLGGESAIGVRARGCVSALVVVSICVGGGVTTQRRFFEVGLLLKYGRRRDQASDADPEPETRGDDEAAAPELELPVVEEGMFVLEAPFQEGVDAPEPGGEADDDTAAEDSAVPSDGAATEIEATPNMLDAESRTDPEIVEPAEVDAVENRDLKTEANP